MENQHINESILSEEILEDQKKNRIDHMKYMPGMEDIGSEILDQVVECSLPYITYDNPVEVRGEIYRKQIAEYVERYSKELEGIVCGEYSVAMETEAVLEAKALKGRIEKTDCFY